MCIYKIVGDIGIEPMASSLSETRSTTELIARVVVRLRSVSQIKNLCPHDLRRLLLLANLTYLGAVNYSLLRQIV
jgi:hypothetical protein